MAPFCHAQARDVLCSDGNGSFEVASSAGVTVQVKATRNGTLAIRTCEATLGWGENTLIIATMISQFDLDAFAVDLGPGVAVATFQLKKSDTDCCSEYQV